MKYRPNKVDMARVITQALYNMKKLPPVDHHKVKSLSRWRRENLIIPYNRACRILGGVAK